MNKKWLCIYVNWMKWWDDFGIKRLIRILSTKILKSIHYTVIVIKKRQREREKMKQNTDDEGKVWLENPPFHIDKMFRLLKVDCITNDKKNDRISEQLRQKETIKWNGPFSYISSCHTTMHRKNWSAKENMSHREKGDCANI